MRNCANFHKGCREQTRGFKTMYCVDCYSTWQTGGVSAVDARLDKLRKPAHVCVGHDQLAAKDAEIAELQAFKAEVVEMHTVRFRGEVKLPNEADLLPRLRMDRATAAAARTAMGRSSSRLMATATLQDRSVLTQQWLQALPERLKFRDAVDSLQVQNLNEQVLALTSKLSDAHAAILAMGCPAQPKVCKHPSAQDKPATEGNQLNRIESLAKQAATGGPSGWPFAAFLLGAVIAYLIK